MVVGVNICYSAVAMVSLRVIEVDTHEGRHTETQMMYHVKGNQVHNSVRVANVGQCGI